MSPSPQSRAVIPDTENRRTGIFLLCLITLFALALRFYRLGDWSLSGDEAFTLAFSTDGFTWRDLRPLAFALNHYIAIPLFGSTDFALRFFPALFGVAAVPLVGGLTWAAYGRTAAIFTALLIAFTPGLIGHSQFARYYMQSFTLTAVVPVSAMLYVRTRRPRWLVIGALCLVAGCMMVPSSAFILPGLAAWLLLARREILGERGLAWIRERRALVIGAVIALTTLAVFAALQVRAAYMVDELATEGVRYSSAAQVVLGTLAVLTLPVTLLVPVGLVLAYRDQRLSRSERWLLPCWTIGSALTFAAAFPFIAIGATHVVSVLAGAFAAAGVALGEFWDATRPRVVALAAVACLLLPGTRDLVSYYADGNRLDYRGAAQLLQQLQREQPARVLAQGHGNLDRYAPELRSEELVFIPDSLRWLDDSTRREPVRLLLTEHRRGLDAGDSEPLVLRILASCALKQRISRDRLDYYVNAVHVFECAPRPMPSTP